MHINPLFSVSLYLLVLKKFCLKGGCMHRPPFWAKAVSVWPIKLFQSVDNFKPFAKIWIRQDLNA